MQKPLTSGQKITRGVCRHLSDYNITTLEEFCPVSKLRVDVFGLGRKGEIWIIECKSSRENFRQDKKWHGYLDWCDRYFWAVDLDFPTEILPDNTGLIIADSYGANIRHYGPNYKLNAARRKKLTLKFARDCAMRLRSYSDPKLG